MVSDAPRWVSARRSLIRRLHHVPALYLITGICGLIDATSFLCFGEVFVELITGNLVFLAFFVGTGHPVARFSTYIEVVVAFAIGAVLGGHLLRRGETKPRLGFFVEWVLLVLVFLIAVVLEPGREGPIRWIVVSLLAITMGLQNALSRRHGVPDLATNVMTLTFTGLIAESRVAGGASERWKRRLGSVGTFFVGAALGALLATEVGPWAPLAAAVVLFTIALAGLTVPQERATKALTRNGKLRLLPRTNQHGYPSARLPTRSALRANRKKPQDSARFCAPWRGSVRGISRSFKLMHYALRAPPLT